MPCYDLERISKVHESDDSKEKSKPFHVNLCLPNIKSITHGQYTHC